MATIVQNTPGMSTRHIITAVGYLLRVCVVGQAGTLDPDFNSTGIVLTDYGAERSYGFDVVVQPDGRIIVIGSAISGSQPGDIALTRYLPNGTLDGTFGNGGISTTTGIPYLTGRAGALQADGKILVGVTSELVIDNVFAVVRFESDGSVDGSFGNGGQAVANIIGGGASGESVFAIAIQADGKILLAGRIAGSDPSDMAVVRFLPDGTLDGSFSNDGILVIPVSPFNDQVRSIIIQDDGRILLAGGASFGTPPNISSRFALVRLLENGSFDSSFGNNGVSTIPVGTGHAFAMAATIQADSRILATGYSGYPGLVTIVRCLPDGSLDGSFGVAGVATTFVASENSTAKGITIQPDGKVLVAAECWDGVGTQFYSALLRYSAAGLLDNDFGTSGIAMTQYSNASIIPEAIAMQSDGKIITTGYWFDGSVTRSAVLRYLNDLDLGMVEIVAGVNSSFVFPNPVSDIARLTYDLTDALRLSFKVMDGSGKAVRTFFTDALRIPGHHTEEFDLSGLAAGQYSVVLCSSAGCASISVVKR